MSTTPRPSAPQHVIVSAFALYARPNGTPIAVSELIRMLASLGIDHQAVRSALVRLKRRGVVASVKVDGVASYAVDPGLEEVFAEGDQRIFAPRRAALGDPWLLVAYSVPESQRPLRHQLRKIFARRGFGMVSAGLAIGPDFLQPELRRELQRAGLHEFVECFRAEHVEADLAEKVRTWWDLDALAAQYQDFLDDYAPVLARWEGERQGAAAEAFADHLAVVTAWRRLPYLDPGLPIEVLPADWPALAAERVFAGLHARLSGPASSYAAGVLSR